ncbi:phytanoyl-CoA dioxygenase family protein [Stappia sp. F7233]|uniref:Phytanoyl-CoA dioxygenase family protein n=1 Tax=Stappia albiluteola TaxID=2758565 RepID=A0A839AFV1_9HYPH|nr:phytanoyl-CoA dioxygenase family protein [Stappia albiluteola]MBA5778531.1 phytanoyl-CoA dioxygenase family protein [Stappia albiluteola]
MMERSPFFDRFARDGYLLAPGFYDVEALISPIQQGIRSIVELLCQRFEVDVRCDTPEEAMTRAYPALIARNRAWGGIVYDAVKQIPDFIALVGHSKNIDLFRELRPGSIPGVAAGGYGIRIDNPGEAKFSAPWHQEFPAQLRSVDGVVFWTPLLPVSCEMGPVVIAEGSHKEGLVPVYEDDGGIGKSGAYSLRLDRETERLEKYSQVAPLTNPGDLVAMDFLTLHRSGENVSDCPRWSIQFRFFNFADQVGQSIDWKGSFAAGQKFSDVLPQLVQNSGRD